MKRAAWALLLLCACAQVELRPPQQVDFDLLGRIAARYRDDGFTGNLNWRHAANGDEMLITTPLGHGVARIVRQGDSVQLTLYARDQNQGVHNVLAATTFTLAPNANLEFRSGGAVITSVTIPADANSASFYVKGKAAGTGSATISATNYSTYTNSITVTP